MPRAEDRTPFEDFWWEARAIVPSDIEGCFRLERDPNLLRFRDSSGDYVGYWNWDDLGEGVYGFDLEKYDQFPIEYATVYVSPRNINCYELASPELGAELLVCECTLEN